MRIHVAQHVTFATISAAVNAAGAYFADISPSEHGSRKADHAFDVKLRGSSNRRPNFYDGGGDYAATWDQWGVFFAYLYDVDPAMVCGSNYAGADDFHFKTSGRFECNTDGFWPRDAHGDHTFRFDGVPRSQACTKCSATVTY